MILAGAAGAIAALMQVATGRGDVQLLRRAIHAKAADRKPTPPKFIPLLELFQSTTRRRFQATETAQEYAHTCEQALRRPAVVIAYYRRIMPKAPKSPGVRDQRHNPLAEEYAPADPWKSKAPKRQKQKKSDKEEDEQKYVDSKSSRKILEIGRELEEEDARENKARRPKEANPAFDFESRMGEDDMPGEDLVQAEDDEEEAWGEEDEEVEEVEIDANDLAAWNKFIPTDDNPIVWPGEEAQPSGPGTDLAALILEKIAAHEAGGEVQHPDIQGGGAPEDAIELPAKVVEGTSLPLHDFVPVLSLHSILKDWPHSEPLQERQATQALQDPPHHPRLGDPRCNHPPR